MIMNKKYPIIDVHKTGQNIKRIMLRRGLTVRDVQEFLELSTPQSIYHWFDGRNMPTVDNLYALSELFQVPVDEMIKGNRRVVFCFRQDSAYNRLLTYYDEFLKRRVG